MNFRKQLPEYIQVTKRQNIIPWMKPINIKYNNKFPISAIKSRCSSTCTNKNLRIKCSKIVLESFPFPCLVMYTEGRHKSNSV